MGLRIALFVLIVFEFSCASLTPLKSDLTSTPHLCAYADKTEIGE
jgi:hypothetical protein